MTPSMSASCANRQRSEKKSAPWRRLGAVDFGTGRWRGDAVGTKYDTGIENGKKRGEIAVAHSGEKSGNDFALARQFGGGNNRRALDAAAGATGELPRGHRRTPHDGCDLVERHVEHVVQHEGKPLGRCQSFKNHE